MPNRKRQRVAATRTNVGCGALALVGQLLQQYAACGRRCQRLRRVSVPIHRRQFHTCAQQALDDVVMSARTGQMQAAVAAVVNVTGGKAVLEQQPHSFHIALHMACSGYKQWVDGCGRGGGDRP
jgi:hypothetical protein